MARPEKPVDPAAPEPVRRIATGLRSARAKANSPGYRIMGERVNYSSTALSQAASGKKMPSLAITLAYITSLESADEDLADWEQRWKQAKQDLDTALASGAASDIRFHGVAVDGPVVVGGLGRVFHVPGVGPIRNLDDFNEVMRTLRARSPHAGSLVKLASEAKLSATLVHAVFSAGAIPSLAMLDRLLSVLGASQPQSQAILEAAVHLRSRRYSGEFVSAQALPPSSLEQVAVQLLGPPTNSQTKQEQKPEVEEPSTDGTKSSAMNITEFFRLLYRLIRSRHFFLLLLPVLANLYLLVSMLIAK